MNKKSVRKKEILSVLTRGFRGRCPKCGTGKLFRAYLKPADNCSHCNEKLGHIRADDIPTYFTVLLVGHVVVPLAVWLEQMYHPSELVHLSLWIPLCLILTFMFLPPIKGALVGLLWRLKPIGTD